MKFKFIPFMLCVLIFVFYACQKEDTIKQIEEPEELISYLTSIRNELDHSSHTYYYDIENNLFRYSGEEYWSDLTNNDSGEIIKEETWNKEGTEMTEYKEFGYNSDGLIDTVDVYWKKEGEYEKGIIVIFEYNQLNQIVKETIYYPIVMRLKRMLYEYDAIGNQTRMEYYDVFSDTTILTQYVTYEYDTCKNVYKGINYPFSFGLLKKTIHDYPNLSRINNITRVDVFDGNNDLLWYVVYDYQGYTEKNYPNDVFKTLYNNSDEILFERYHNFIYLEEELIN